MPSFAYTARDQTGAASSGVLSAESIGDATRLLRDEGKYPTAVRPAVEPDARIEELMDGNGVKISRAEVIQISTQLAIMVETGVTISEALDCIAAQTDKPHVRRLVEDLSQQVQGGGDFSSALARHPRSFPKLFVSLMRASEKSGMLSKLLNRATAYMRDEQEIVRRVKGAMTYPTIMFSFAVVTTIFLLAFVLPRFTGIYASNAAALPAPTRILMAISEAIVGNWMLLLGGVIGLLVGGWLWSRTQTGSRALDWVKLNMPLFGPILRKLHLARGMRMVGTLASAGVNVVDCVSAARDLSPNSYFRDLWEEVSEQIQSGRQLSEPLFESELVPRSVAQMIHSGEKSGKLGFVLEQVSSFAEEELKETITEMTRYIEPVMIVAMGVIIGGVTLALLLPIFTVSRVVAG